MGGSYERLINIVASDEQIVVIERQQITMTE